jgi:hypothetical protein
VVQGAPCDSVRDEEGAIKDREFGQLCTRKCWFKEAHLGDCSVGGEQASQRLPSALAESVPDDVGSGAHGFDRGGQLKMVEGVTA